MKNRLFVYIAAVSLAIATSASAQTVLVDYDFNGLTVNTALAGQDGWTNFVTNGSTGPFVRSVTPTNLTSQIGGSYATDSQITRAYRSFGNFDLTSASVITLEFNLLIVGNSGQAVAGIGNVTAGTASTLPPVVGSFSSTGFQIRAAGDGTQTSAVASNGSAIVPILNNLYQVRSVWDLSTATATLEIMNLSAGETQYTQLFFNQAQTQATASLGTLGNVALWDDFLIRTGGNSGQGGFIDNVYITAVPEPSIFALAGLGAAVLLARRRRSQV